MYRIVLTRVVTPPFSSSLIVDTASPGYHGSSNCSVHTSRSGLVISRYSPPAPISISPFFQPQRYFPPTLRSISHTSSDHPSGPNIHCLRYLHSVCARNTRSFGALNVLLITNSLSPFASSVTFIFFAPFFSSQTSF